MAQKNYCDRCGIEVGCLRGNEYSASRAYVDEFDVLVKIYLRNHNSPADICAICVKEIAAKAFGGGC